MADHEYTYLIVGGGMAADAAARGIREVDPHGAIGLIGAEPDPPYKRPPLSKKLWHGKPLGSIWLETESLGVDLHLGHAARVLDLRQKIVVDDRGTVFGFDKLLLATGVAPRHLPVGGHRVIAYRTVDNYHRLRQEAERGKRFAVIGGGFIGSEIAAALVSNGVEVTMIFPGSGIGDHLFPPDLAESLTDVYRDHGVEVLANAVVTDVVESGDRLILRTHHVVRADSRDIAVDGIVAGIGSQPNTALALTAGLAVNDGIVVDTFLRTGHPDVYAAGDVVTFWQSALGKCRRVEHEDNATTMGRHAGRAMAGEPAPYEHLPFFYSDMFDLGYEAVGEIDSRLEMVAEWEEPYRKGVVTYRQDDRVRGVLNWNVWDRVDAARALIGEAAGSPSVAPQAALVGAH
ncbi:MAG: pyridine nucleotide-disulfide oxidoreductase [Thermomicrobiales bacterium]|jgi:3-phenylpropionate/trans-cinnamate dioxygenase ferredoxin reductase component|nr:pyridine nucleotide-disulfide oxidoreductase [Thermomicrobiales bacterium]